MSSADLDYLNPRMQQAIVEMEGLITSRYPGTTFASPTATTRPAHGGSPPWTPTTSTRCSTAPSTG